MIRQAIIFHGIDKKKNYVGHSNIFHKRIKDGKEVEGTQVVRVYVRKKEPIEALAEGDVIPREITVGGGKYEVDVVELEPKALSGQLVQKVRPVQPGYSVGHYLVTAGSIGAVVYFNGQPLLLSNNHVLANCYDSETEVLTPNGWKRFSDLTDEDFVLTLEKSVYDRGYEANYRKPIRRIVSDYDGEMVRIESKFVDLLITPNHKLVVFSNPHGEMGFAEAGSFLGGKFRGTIPHQYKRNVSHLVMPSVTYEKGADHNMLQPISMTDWCYFLGWWLADGSLGKNKNPEYFVTIRAVNRSDRKEAVRLLSRMGFKPFNSDAGQYVSVASKQLYFVLAPLKKEGKGRKHFPRWVLDIERKYIRSFLEGYVKGDGNRSKDGDISITTVERELADGLQEAILRLGFNSQIRIVKGSTFNPEGVYYQVSWSKKRGHNFRVLKKHISKQHYKGKVYCVEVPSHVILVRRNGKVTWCGNSSSVQFRTANIGDAVLQPGAYDGGKITDQDAGDCIGSLYDFIPIDTQQDNLVDCALATPLKSTLVNNTYPAPINAQVSGWKMIININDALRYVGRSSGYKEVVVLDPSARLQVNYGVYIATFDDVFTFTPSAIPGDSGSGLLDGANNLAGLVFAGDTTNNIGIGVKISNILQAFAKKGITLDYRPAPLPQLSPDSVVLVNHTYLEIATPTITVEYLGGTITQAVTGNIYCLLKNSAGQTVYIQSANNVVFYPQVLGHLTDGIFPLINVPAGTYRCHTFVTTPDNLSISRDYEFDVTITKPWLVSEERKQ